MWQLCTIFSGAFRLKYALGNTPIAMAESSSGLIEVENILNAISYGGVV